MIVTMSWYSCGGDSNENIDVEENPMAALAKMGEQMQEQAKNMEQGTREGGPALHYEELIKFLPETINGYTKEEPSGSTVEIQGASYSTAEVRFTKGDQYVRVSLIDYNATLSMYSMATAMWSTGIKVDNSDELAQTIKLNDKIAGWESFQKKSKDASIILGVNNRFFLTIEANSQSNTEFLKEVAKSMKLDDLSSL